MAEELGLPLRSGGNSLQTPDDWISRIQGSALALVVADREADTRASLQRWPFGHGAQELGRIGGSQQLEG